LTGLAMTILAWYGPWAWPGWPGATALDFALAHAAPSVVPFGVKAAGMVALILLNSGAWAATVWVLATAVHRLRTR
jgi:hypothetical protein